MGQYEYEKEGIVTDSYGRFAIVMGFNMTGHVLIKAESLCLKLRTGWVPPILAGNGGRAAKNNLFDNNASASPPNLAKILTKGDRISFDAEVAKINSSNGQNSGNGIRWLASQGSVKVLEVCTRTKIYNGYANIIEVSNFCCSFFRDSFSFPEIVIFLK